jgi:ABC-2 type transport system permease protein
VTDIADPVAPVRSMRPRTALALHSLLRADLTVLARSGRTLVLNVVVPILYLVITALHLGRGGITHLDAEFSISLALTVGLVSSSLIGYSGMLARDRELGVFQRLRVTPAPTWAIMASRLLVQLIVDLVMAVVVLVAGSIIHATVFTAQGYLLAVAVSLAGGAMFLALGQALVALVPSAAAVNAVGRIVFVVFLLLGLLGATGILGSTVQGISDWTPVGALINLYTGVLQPAAWDWTNTSGLLATLAYAAAGAFVGIRWFRWESP